MLSKRATIQDVADLAGVSRAAVSKVLRNAYGLSDEMRTRVDAAIKALDYRPRPEARGLRGRTYTLGISLPDIRNPFFPDIVDGIFEKLRPSPYQPLISVRPKVDSTECDAINMMLDRKVDGLILVAPHVPDDYLERVTAAVPTVILGLHEGRHAFDTVNVDDRAGGEAVADYLVGLGHRRIGYIGLNIDDVGETNSTSQRYFGFVAAMRRHGLEDRMTVANCSHRSDALPASAVARAMLSEPERPTAIFAWMDSVAITLMSVAEEMGLRIPEDLAVIGYDNSSLSALSQVSLTSIDQSGRLLGETCARLVMERIDGRTEDVHFLVRPKLIVRRSSGAPTGAL